MLSCPLQPFRRVGHGVGQELFALENPRKYFLTNDRKVTQNRQSIGSSNPEKRRKNGQNQAILAVFGAGDRT